LEGNGLGDANMSKIARSIYKCSSLELLDLSRNMLRNVSRAVVLHLLKPPPDVATTSSGSESSGGEEDGKEPQQKQQQQQQQQQDPLTTKSLGLKLRTQKIKAAMANSKQKVSVNSMYARLTFMSHLKVLNLSANFLQETGIEALTVFAATLEDLDLSSNCLTCETLALHLHKFGKLKYLHLKSANVSADAVKLLSQCFEQHGSKMKLTVLDLSSNFEIKPANFNISLLPSLKKLTKLHSLLVYGLFNTTVHEKIQTALPHVKLS